ncbi:hypothetical protein RG47T_0303 [Mucilaginibacter polytrichastri]|uniref:Uncharacterized protein n=1 Tax=Mucilaginibacter polytrichastri TaxID=1302689 RepID=A0A1Q5ZSX7_9SPHI|nr:hypothetical protein RG47T_0303 [Mucilaginibacter polytrichastri]
MGGKVLIYKQNKMAARIIYKSYYILFVTQYWHHTKKKH